MGRKNSRWAGEQGGRWAGGLGKIKESIPYVSLRTPKVDMARPPRAGAQHIQ